MDDKDDIDDEDDDKPSFLSNLSRQPSLARRVGNMTDSTPEVYLSQRQMGPSAVLFSFSFTPSTALSSSRFSSPAGRQASLYEDSVEDLSPPTSLPPPPTVKATSGGQGQPKKEETVRDLEMQIKELQARLEEKKMLEKKDQLPFTANNSVQRQSSENRDSDTTVKVEGLNNIGGQEELEKPSEKVENSSEVVIENNDYAPFKSANKKEVPISTLLKKDSFNKTKFSQEDFLKSILSSPPTSAKGVSEGKDVTGAWTFPLPVKNHGIEISNKDMHQIPKQLADGGSKDFRGAGRFGEENGMDSSWDTMEEGVFENKFFEADLPQEVVEISLPPNPNIPHTRSKRTEGYIYTDQNSFDFNDVNQTDSKSNSVIIENIPGKTLSTTENCPDSNIQSIYSNDSTAYSDLPPLKYPDHSPIGPPSTAGDGQNPLLSNVSNIDSGQSTQLPPKSKSQEQPSSSGDTSAFKSELDENDISGYHEFNDSNKSSYSKFTGNSSTHSVSRYSNYMSSLQSLSDHHGFIIKDVTPDGNCMFSAIIDQLRIQGNFDLTPNSLRKTAVEYLRDNPKNMDGTHLESFLSTETWSEYLNRMGQESQWGDHMVLQACTEVTGQQIVVFKPNANKTVLVPTAEEPLENTSLTLGHIGESHFVSLRPKDWETNWPLMAHAHRAKMKEKQKLARKKVREMKKLKKRKKAPDSTVSNKEDSTAVDGTGNEEGEEIGSEKQKETGSEKEETGSGTEVTESEETTQEAVTSTESDKDEDGSEEEADSDDSQFKTTDDIVAILHDRRSIDKESKVPMLHLEYLLRSQLPPCPSLFGSIYIHATEKSTPHFTIEYLGSCTEQLRMYMHHQPVDLKCCGKLQSKQVPSATVVEGRYVRNQEEKPQSLYDSKADETDCFPGYLRLIPDVPRMWPHWALLILPDGKTCLASDANKGCHTTTQLMGLRCSHWPAAALEWISRHRPSNWPAEQVVHSAQEEGCLVISRAHPLSSFPDTEWQYVFPCTERLLALDALTDDMRHCFRVFKCLVDYYLIKATARLKTTHLKTVLYFACETISIDLWRENKAGCLIYLLQMLLRYLTAKRLPNYFIIGNNMLDGFTDEQLALFTTTIQAIRSFPIHAISFMLDHYGTRCLDSIHLLIDDIQVFRRNPDVSKTVERVFVPHFLQHFSLFIIFKAYQTAAHMLHGAYFFIEAANRDDSSKNETVVSFHDFVVQTLKVERMEDITNVSIYLDQLFGTRFQEFYRLDITKEAAHSDTQKDSKSTMLQDNGSSDNVSLSEKVTDLSVSVLPKDVTLDKEKHTFRQPEHRLKDLLGSNTAGKYADKLLPIGTMDSIVLKSKFLQEFVHVLHGKKQYEDCARIANCAIDLIKQNQADQLDVSSIEDPSLRREVEKHHNNLKSYLNEFYSMLVLCQQFLETEVLTHKQLEDFKEVASNNALIVNLIETILSRGKDHQ